MRSSKRASIGDGVCTASFSAPGWTIGEFSARWLTSGSMKSTSTSGSAKVVPDDDDAAVCAAGGVDGSTGGGWNMTSLLASSSRTLSSRSTPFLAAISL